MSFFIPLFALAQAPELINYQAVARDAESGVELADRDVYIVCKILADGPDGQIIYQEAHENVRTNRYGLFNIRIGGGSALSGRFEDLSWHEGTRYLEIDMDAGEGLETLGAMQLVSVPYALHAKTADMTDDADADPTNELIDEVQFDPETRILTVSEAGNIHTVVIPGIEEENTSAIQNFSFNPETGALTILENDTPWSADMSWLTTDLDPNNELISSVQFNENELIIRITEGGVTHNIDLSALSPDGSLDNDPANELITDVAFDEDSSVLSVTDPGNTFSVNLAALIDDADADPANELITDFEFDEISRSLSLTDAGGTRTVSLDALAEDADSDPENELLTEVTFDEDNAELSITDPGNTFSVNLAALIDDADADPANELITDFEFDEISRSLSLTDAGGTRTVSLDALAEDADSDPENELLTEVAFDEDNAELSITDPGNTFSVNLAALIDDADADPANELITNVNFDPSNNMIRIQEGGNNFLMDLTALSNAAGNDDDRTNELITAFEFDDISSILSVTDSGQTFSVNLAALINDADSDPTNELLTGVNFNPTTSILRIADAGDVYQIDLSPLIEDGDADPTNELQSIADVLAHGVTPGDAGGARIRNIGAPQDAQDAATKTFVENVPLSGDLSGNAADAKVEALQGVALSDAAPADGQVLKYSAAEEKWVPGNTAPTGASGAHYYAVDPSDFKGTRKSGEDDYNIALFEDDDRFVTISDRNGADKIIAPLHLPHGAVLRDIDVVFTKYMVGYNIFVTIERKNIYTGNTNTLGSWNSGGMLPGGIQSERIDLSSAPLSQRTVDLSEYSYRMVVRFNIFFDIDEPSDAAVRLYGARMRYGF